MKKILKILLIAIIIVILFIPLIISVSNDNISKNVVKNLKSISLPDNSELIDSIYVSGKLTGNGNGMQYFGAILIKTDLSEEELNDYYKPYKKDEWSFLIKKQNSSKIDVIEHGNYNFEKYNKEDEAKYFIIYSWGVSNNDFLVEWDLRGH